MSKSADKAGARRVTRVAQVTAGAAVLGAGALAIAQLPGLEPEPFVSNVVSPVIDEPDEATPASYDTRRVIDALAVHLAPEPKVDDGDAVADANGETGPGGAATPSSDSIRYIGRLGSWAVVVVGGDQKLARVGQRLAGGEVREVTPEFLSIETQRGGVPSVRQIPIEVGGGPSVVQLSAASDADQDAARAQRLRDRQAQMARDRAAALKNEREEAAGAEGR